MAHPFRSDDTPSNRLNLKLGLCDNCKNPAHQHTKKRVTVADSGGRWHYRYYCPDASHEAVITESVPQWALRYNDDHKIAQGISQRAAGDGSGGGGGGRS